MPGASGSHPEHRARVSKPRAPGLPSGTILEWVRLRAGPSQPEAEVPRAQGTPTLTPLPSARTQQARRDPPCGPGGGESAPCALPALLPAADPLARGADSRCTCCFEPLPFRAPGVLPSAHGAGSGSWRGLPAAPNRFYSQLLPRFQVVKRASALLVLPGGWQRGAPVSLVQLRRSEDTAWLKSAPPWVPPLSPEVTAPRDWANPSGWVAAHLRAGSSPARRKVRTPPVSSESGGGW